MSANIVNHNNAENAITPTKKSDNADAGSAAALSPAANDISPKAAENNKKTPAKRTPSKRLSYIERAQKESEELVRTMGGTLELEGGRRTRSSARGTPTAQTPPPAKKTRSSPAATNTPRGRGRGRKLNTPDSEVAKEEVSEQLVETSPKGKERKQSLSTIDEDKPDVTETDATVLTEKAENSEDTASEVAKANSIDHKTEKTSEAEPMDTDAEASPAVAEVVKPVEKTVESHKENAMEVDATTTAAVIKLDSEEDTMDEQPAAKVAATDAADAKVTQNAAKDDAKTLTTTTTVPAVVSEISSADTTNNTTTTTTTTVITSKTASNESEATEKHKNGVTDLEIETETATDVVADDNTDSSNNNNDAAQKVNAAPIEATLAAGDAANKLQNEICEQKNCTNIEAAAAAADVGKGDGVTN